MSSLRHTVRLLLKDRSFTVTALLTLALCIGANTAIFSVVRSVVLRPLPVPEADRLVQVYNSYPNAGAERAGAAVPDYFDRLKAVPALEVQSVFRQSGATLGADKGAERLKTVVSSASFFRMLQVQPVIGTLFTENDEAEGAPRRVLLSHAMWQRRYAGDSSIVGREIRLNGNVTTVAGCCRPTSSSSGTTSTSSCPPSSPLARSLTMAGTATTGDGRAPCARRVSRTGAAATGCAERRQR
ncbi:MAG: ABC transporter permease [Acidobacteria bacterium]|nr:ABC transporter permease [Acidobacteriota bacterium]